MTRLTQGLKRNQNNQNMFMFKEVELRFIINKSNLMVKDMNRNDGKILQKVGTLDWEGVDNFPKNQEKHVHSKQVIKQK
jgi:hypothetical protein